jgi:hypothetical protein
MVKTAETEVVRMESFYPGLVRLGRSEFVDRKLVDEAMRTSQLKQRESQFAFVGEIRAVFAPKIMCTSCSVVLHENYTEQWERAMKNMDGGSVIKALEAESVCSSCQHSRSLLDLATTFRVPERRSCPCCLRKEVFNVDECRVQYFEVPNAEQLRTRTVTCDHCVADGLWGQVWVPESI